MFDQKVTMSFVRSATAGLNAHLMSPEIVLTSIFFWPASMPTTRKVDEALHYSRRVIKEGYARVHEVYESTAVASLRTDP